MAEAIQAHLRKLNIPNPYLQHQIVAAVFQGLQKDRNVTVDAVRDVVSKCLNNTSAAVVEETVDRLIALTLVRKDVSEYAMDMLLAALVSVQPSCATALSRGVVDLFFKLNVKGSIPFHEVRRGKSHPFVTAWFSNPAVPYNLITALTSHMAHMAHVAHTSSDTAATRKLLEAFQLLKPFVVHVILVGPNTSKGSAEVAEWQLAGASLCEVLIRWGFSYPALTQPCIHILLHCLQHCTVSLHSSALTLLPCLPAVIDLIELIIFSDEEDGNNNANSTATTATLHPSTVAPKPDRPAHSDSSNQRMTGRTFDSKLGLSGQHHEMGAPSSGTTHCSTGVYQLVHEFVSVLVQLSKRLASDGQPYASVLACLVRIRHLPHGCPALARQLLQLAELAVDASAADFEVLGALLLAALKHFTLTGHTGDKQQLLKQSASQSQSQSQSHLQSQSQSQSQSQNSNLSASIQAVSMLLFPVLPKLVLSTSVKNKAWASHLLAAVQQCEQQSYAQLTAPQIKEVDTVRAASPASPAGPAGAAGAAHAGRAGSAASAWSCRWSAGLKEGRADVALMVSWLVHVLGLDGEREVDAVDPDVPEWLTCWKGAATEWLHSLQLCLHFAHTKSSTTPRNPSTFTCMTLTALLSHSSPVVRMSAATTLRQILLLQPLLGLQFTPIVLYCLNSTAWYNSDSTARYCSDSTAAHSTPHSARRTNTRDMEVAAQLKSLTKQALLHVLPAMAADSNMSSYAQRALQPLMSPSCPAEVYTGGLRLVVDMWALTGKGWNKVEDALIGYTDPRHKPPPLRLRLARAGLVLQVCQADTAKGLQLIPAIQQCATDTDPVVASIGLEALDVLCKDNTLDFYKAFSVLHKWHPTLPVHPMLAGKWVGIMGRGAMDAEAYPDRATAIIELLWSVMDHSSEEVRAAAYSALSAYPLELLEKLEVAADLEDYVNPCMTERSAAAQAAAEELAVAALTHEHEHRRRFLLLSKATPEAAGAADSKELSILTHRLSHTLSRQLCPSSRLHNPNSQTSSPSHPASSLLLSHLPFKQPTQQPPTPKFKQPKPTAKSSAPEQPLFDKDVQDVVLLALKHMQWNEWMHPWNAIHAWEVFFKRWDRSVGGLSAVEVNAAVELLTDLWQRGDAGEEANCYLAAAGLCGVLMQGQSSGQHHTTVLHLLDTICGKLLQERSSTVHRALMGAAVHITCSLEPCDSSTWGGTVQLLCQHMGQGDRFVAECVSTSADAAAFLCCSLLKKEAEGVSAEMNAVLSASATVLSLLLALLSILWPHHAAAILDLVALLPGNWSVALPDLRPDFMEALLLNEDGQLAVVPHVVQAVAILLVQLCRAHRADAAVIQSLLEVLREELRPIHQTEQTSLATSLSRQGVAAARAALQALPVLLLAGWADQWISDEDMDAELHMYRNVAASRTLDGQLVAAAAWGMSQLLYSVLQEGATPSPEVTQCVQQLTGPLTNKESKQPHSSARRCGAAVALATLLGSRPAWSTSLLLSSHPRGVLAATASTGAARTMLKALEEAALAESDPRVSGVAAWVLSDVCYNAAQLQDAATGGDSEGKSSGPELKPVSAYPVNGAVRPLVEALLDPQKRSQLSTGSVACVLRCLSRCPRLPSANWSGLTRSLVRGMRPAGSTHDTHAAHDAHGAQDDLPVAIIGFLLAHVHTPQFGLTAVLEELLVPARFGGLPTSAQVLLCQELGIVVAHLPAGRALALCQSLGSILKAVKSDSRSKVATALWRGLGNAAGGKDKSQAPSPHVLNAIQRGASSLLLELPAPVPLLPGHILQLAAAVLTKGELMQPAAVHPHAAYQVPVPFSHPCSDILDVYAAAAYALSQLDQSFALSLLDVHTSTTAEAAARAILLRSLLVLSGRCSGQQLVGCQSWLMNLNPVYEGLPCVEAALVSVALGLSTADPKAQVQALKDTLNASQASANPNVGVVLAACMVAAYQHQGDHTAVGDVCFTLMSPQAAVLALPHTLAALMQTSAVWRAHADGLSHVILELLESRKCSRQLAEQVLQGLLAIRHTLSYDAWSHVVDTCLS